MSSNMNRRPSLLVRIPPSPRTPSVTRMPRTLGGHTMPVGWNWTNSMSISSGAGWYGGGGPPAGRPPAVAGDLEGAPDAAGGEHHRLGLEHPQVAALAVIGEGAGDALAVL